MFARKKNWKSKQIFGQDLRRARIHTRTSKQRARQKSCQRREQRAAYQQNLCTADGRCANGKWLMWKPLEFWVFPSKCATPPRSGSTQNVAFRFDLNLVAGTHIFVYIFYVIALKAKYMRCLCLNIFLLSHVKFKIAFPFQRLQNEMEWIHLPLNDCLHCTGVLKRSYSRRKFFNTLF